MFSLPATTEIKKALPKKAIYEKFALKAAQRDAFDADISRIDIVNVVSSNTVPGLKEGEQIKEFYVLQVKLKREKFDPKNILLLTKLIKQNMVFALTFGLKVRFAIVHQKLFVGDWVPLEEAALLLVGMDLEQAWAKIVKSIGGFEVMDGVTVEEQISLDIERQKRIKQIENLEKKLKTEKQPIKRYDLFKEIQELKLSIKQV